MKQDDYWTLPRSVLKPKKNITTEELRQKIEEAIRKAKPEIIKFEIAKGKSVAAAHTKVRRQHAPAPLL